MAVISQIPLELFHEQLKKEIEAELQERALKEADRLAVQYSDFLRKEFASISTSAGLMIAERLSIMHTGTDLRIELSIKDKRTKPTEREGRVVEDKEILAIVKERLRITTAEYDETLNSLIEESKKFPDLNSAVYVEHQFLHINGFETDRR